jgi:hypothetical protein
MRESEARLEEVWRLLLATPGELVMSDEVYAAVEDLYTRLEPQMRDCAGGSFSVGKMSLGGAAVALS